MREFFDRFAKYVSSASGKPSAFAMAALVIVVWAITGPIFRFDNTWQLVINTGTTIITFLMVFLIQNSQNRDTAALQLKIDELIRVTATARNELLDLEELDDKSLKLHRDEYERLAESARQGATGTA